jgi:hypothetical protein
VRIVSTFTDEKGNRGQDRGLLLSPPTPYVAFKIAKGIFFDPYRQYLLEATLIEPCDILLLTQYIVS